VALTARTSVSRGIVLKRGRSYARNSNSPKKINKKKKSNRKKGRVRDRKEIFRMSTTSPGSLPRGRGRSSEKGGNPEILKKKRARVMRRLSGPAQSGTKKS